jgi:hypothetical protein
MSAAIWGCDESADRVALMHRLRDLDRHLGGYAAELTTALEQTTDELLARMGSGSSAAIADGLIDATGGYPRGADVR